MNDVRKTRTHQQPDWRGIAEHAVADRDRWKADADRLAAALRSTLLRTKQVDVALAAHDALTAETEGK